MKKKAKSSTAMNNLELNAGIEEQGWINALPEVEKISQEVFGNVIGYVKEHEEIDFLNLNKPLSVNLALSNDKHVHELNNEFRNMDKPTNVLSFANIDDENFEQDISLSDKIELGDIIIAFETMQREAKEKNITLHDHYCHLFTHGLLHLLGFDHIEDDEAEYMEDFEIQILKTMDIANPYQE